MLVICRRGYGYACCDMHASLDRARVGVRGAHLIAATVAVGYKGMAIVAQARLRLPWLGRWFSLQELVQVPVASWGSCGLRQVKGRDWGLQ